MAVEDVEPFRTMALLPRIEERQRAGLPIYRMDLGEPNRPLSRALASRIASRVAAEPARYTDARGIAPLRDRIARHYADEYEIEIAAGQIIVTAGASAALQLALLSSFRPGDGVAIARPGYPAYRNMLRAFHQRPIEMDCGLRTGFKVTADTLDAAFASGAKGAIISSPANPTGVILDAAEIEPLAASARARNAILISDEIYHGLTFGRPCASLAGRPGVFAVNSFSKFWRMTGWRLGWLVCPPEHVEPVTRLSQNLFLCPAAPAQWAAMEAFDEHDNCTAAVEDYRANRTLLLAALRRLGISQLAEPDGAFYVYADFSSFTGDAEQLLARLLDETGVAAAPGVDFDPDAASWVRFSLAGEVSNFAEGVGRLECWLDTTRP